MSSREPDSWSPRPVRNHRRPARQRLAGCLGLLAFCGVPLAGPPIRLGTAALVDRVGVAGGLALLAALPVGLVVAWRGWRSGRHRQVLRWAGQHGWSPVAGRCTWPWTVQQLRPEDVRVLFAVAGEMHGLPVTVGELSWRRDGLGGAADRSAGQSGVRGGPPSPVLSRDQRAATPYAWPAPA